MRGNGTSGDHRARPRPAAPVAAPAVFCPLPPRIAAGADEAHRAALHWATRHGLLERPRAQAAFAAARFANLIARGYPAASVSSLSLGAAWLTAVFALDDLLEAKLVAEPAESRAAITGLLSWLRGGLEAPPASRVLGRPLTGALAEVWQRTLPRVSPEWRTRFVEHFAAYLNGTIWESDNRAQGRQPTSTEYLVMRQHTAAIEMFFDLIEPMNGIVVPAEVLHDPDYLTVRRSAGTAIGLFNDLVSWPKELAVGDLHNIVFVLSQERGIALSEAVTAAVVEHDAQVATFIAAREALLGGAWGDDPAVVAAVGDMGHWVRGNVDWSAESGRYSAAPGVPTQRGEDE
jgi:hypothetical protein